MYELIIVCPDLALFDRVTTAPKVETLRSIAQKRIDDFASSTYDAIIYIARGTALVEMLFDSSKK
jgi:hypothetical protein